jgi:hypothetical protein
MYCLKIEAVPGGFNVPVPFIPTVLILSDDAFINFCHAVVSLSCLRRLIRLFIDCLPSRCLALEAFILTM